MAKHIHVYLHGKTKDARQEFSSYEDWESAVKKLGGVIEGSKNSARAYAKPFITKTNGQAFGQWWKNIQKGVLVVEPTITDLDLRAKMK